jgi:hypothetical protein
MMGVVERLNMPYAFFLTYEECALGFWHYLSEIK